MWVATVFSLIVGQQESISDNNSNILLGTLFVLEMKGKKNLLEMYVRRKDVSSFLLKNSPNCGRLGARVTRLGEFLPNE
jgi:hypothetical protein